MAWPETVRKTDLKIETFRGSGAGGQNRNKRDTAVRITHLPTNIVTTAQEERTQGANLRAAWRRLVAQLVPIMQKERLKARYRAPAETVRTYHEPDQRVTDVRVPGQQWNYDRVVHGLDVGEVIEAVIRK